MVAINEGDSRNLIGGLVVRVLVPSSDKLLLNLLQTQWTYKLLLLLRDVDVCHSSRVVEPGFAIDQKLWPVTVTALAPCRHATRGPLVRLLASKAIDRLANRWQIRLFFIGRHS